MNITQREFEQISSNPERYQQLLLERISQLEAQLQNPSQGDDQQRGNWLRQLEQDRSLIQLIHQKYGAAMASKALPPGHVTQNQPNEAESANASQVRDLQSKSSLSHHSRNNQHLLPKKRLTTLLSQLDPNERLDTDVEEVLLLLADEFIDSVTRSACELAKHRKSNQLGVQDLQLHLERNWNIRIPGFSESELRTLRKPTTLESHKQRLQSIRKIQGKK